MNATMIVKKALTIIILLISIISSAVFILFYFFVAPTSNMSVQDDVLSVDSAAADFDAGDLDKAIFKTEKLVASSNSDVDSLLLLATSYAEKGSVSFAEEDYGQKAIDTARKVFAIEPENSEAYRIIGYANEIMGKYDEARKNYDKSIILDPKNSQAYSNKGHSYDLQGDIKNALIWYDNALAVNPSDEHALLNKSRVLARQGASEDAKNMLDILLDTSSNKRFLAEADQIYAFVLMNEKPADYEGALEAIIESIAYDSTVPQSYVTLAQIKLHNTLDLATKNEFNKSLADINQILAKALLLNPNQSSAYYLSSEVARLSGDKIGANTLRQKALDAIPKDITLGAKEKIDMKATIQALIK